MAIAIRRLNLNPGVATNIKPQALCNRETDSFHWLVLVCLSGFNWFNTMLLALKILRDCKSNKA